jgi:hypothetical protein
VIKDGEDGVPFWATESAGVGTPVSLTIEVVPTNCFVESSSPLNCCIDARQPSKPDGTNPAGWSAVELTFSAACNTGAMAAGNFNVTVTPAGTAPVIDDVTVAGQVVTLHFASIIPVGKWTCVEYTGNGDTICLGYHPANVNGDSTSAAADILAIINCLNLVQPGVYCPWGIASCDVDRSGLCAPADILRVIDLLNGADAYVPWLGQPLPACPSP